MNRAAREKVSVVMPVHNAMPHLDDAVQSILGQTYSDFELVFLRPNLGHPVLRRNIEDRPFAPTRRCRRFHRAVSSCRARSNTVSNIRAFSRPVFWL